jgi:hypothetical protein
MLQGILSSGPEPALLTVQELVLRLLKNNLEQRRLSGKQVLLMLHIHQAIRVLTIE